MCGFCSSCLNTCHNVGGGALYFVSHGVHMEHGLDYEYIVSTSNVLLFGINIKCIQKLGFELM